MKIRHAKTGDLPELMELYCYARAFMTAHGNPNQWASRNWPPQSLIEQDIRQGKSYVCINDSGAVIGAFFFDSGKDVEPTYRDITDGNWLDDSAYGVIHRIAGNGSQKGIGEFCIRWAYRQCGHLRMDTHGDNTVMQNLLKKLGFVHCGTIYVKEDNDPRLAFERSEAVLDASGNA